MRGISYCSHHLRSLHQSWRAFWTHVGSMTEKLREIWQDEIAVVDTNQSFATGAYALAFPPHLYEFSAMLRASRSITSNTLPRVNLENLRGKIPESTWRTIAAARGAHLNALEGFPLFAAAMIAGNYARLPARDLNIAAAEYLGARIVYTVLYMTVRTEAASYLRTGAWIWSIGIPFYVLWKAGNRVMKGDLSGKVM